MKKSNVVSKHYLLNPQLILQAKKVLGAKTETETIHMSLKETIETARFQSFLKQSAWKFDFKGFDFSGDDEQDRDH